MFKFKKFFSRLLCVLLSTQTFAFAQATVSELANAQSIPLENRILIKGSAGDDKIKYVKFSFCDDDCTSSFTSYKVPTLTKDALRSLDYIYEVMIAYDIISAYEHKYRRYGIALNVGILVIALLAGVALVFSIPFIGGVGVASIAFLGATVGNALLPYIVAMDTKLLAFSDSKMKNSFRELVEKISVDHTRSNNIAYLQEFRESLKSVNNSIIIPENSSNVMP